MVGCHPTLPVMLPAVSDLEVARVEEGFEAFGLFALDFECAVGEFAAAAEGRFQVVKQGIEFFIGPCRRKTFEDENGFAAAVRGFTSEEEAFFFERCGTGRDGRAVCPP